MAKQLQLRRGTTSQHSTFTGAAGEVTVDTDKQIVVVHDGSTAGGHPLNAVPSTTGNSGKFLTNNGTTASWDSIELGTDTNGNYVADITPGAYLNKSGTAGEGWSPTLNVNGTTLNSPYTLVARDNNGGFSCGVITGYLNGGANTATRLATARTINGVSFDGTANITVEPNVERDDTSNASRYITFVDDSTEGNKRLNMDNSFYYNPQTNTLTADYFSGALSGNATTASTLQTARTINGVSFNGSANITVADSTKLPLTGGTLTGDLTVNTTLNVRGAIDLEDNDYLRLGTSDDWLLYHNGSNNYMDLVTADLYIRDNGTSRFLFERTTGNFTATGNVTAYSDERLKKDWLPVAEDFVERLSKVKSGTYTRIDTDERQAGSSAQDWQALLPEAVLESEDEQKTLSLAYGNAALVSSVELAKRVVEQEERIKKLEALVEKLLGE